ncbi:type II secretion system F family protein [Nocardioides sp. TF02-7]|uniref:type II secretion system F family protein n=1 Tax=Nocardioides sp. TF02-7 TaxID=2917724 RepID=UPI001F06C252|nr:type II secretion system F family protein [Nocardioides sp. TF02-7]UMG92059.1 type II secretion system F family protein [Nocardioides sp. TF02-7]
MTARPTPVTAVRLAAAVLAGLVSVLVVLLLPSAAWAEDPTIAHVESTGEGLRVLVSVPAGAEVDLDGVTATLDGDDLDATAEHAGTDTSVQRTTILAIDTSDSMARRGRFDAAKAAALTFLATVPADVAVGIVTFDGGVTTALDPTTDRGAAEVVVEGLTLDRGTLLYDGLLASLDLAGDDGQRTVLVLSDGADTGDVTALDDVTAAIEDAAALVDVVSLDERGPRRAAAALEELADAGQGPGHRGHRRRPRRGLRVRGRGAGRPGAGHRSPLPAGFAASEATVEVTLPSPTGDLVARAFARIQDAPAETTAPVAAPALADEGRHVPSLGALRRHRRLRPRPADRRRPPGAGQAQADEHRRPGVGLQPRRCPGQGHLQAGSRSGAGPGKGRRGRGVGAQQGLGGQAGRAAGCGRQPAQPSEWLLVHVAIVVVITVLGLLVGRGSLLVAVLFLVCGLFVPRTYLWFKANRRRNAFDAALPDTLQLIAGSLSAGLSLPQAVDTITREGQEPIAGEFKRVLMENRIGMTLEDSFEGVAERFGSKDFAWVVMAIRIQRQVGGNLAELLTTVAGTMRERAYLRRQVNALAAEGKLSAVILTALPPGFLVFQLLTNRDFVMPLFNEPLGLLMLVGGFLWLGVGAFWMSRTVKVEV